MLSQPSTKFILKTAEPKAAKWASELIGEVEIERVRETIADGKRAGKSFMMDRQIEPLVMGSEIEGLDDLHSFVKLGNYVSRFSFPPMETKKIAEGLVLRDLMETPLSSHSSASKPSETRATGSAPPPPTQKGNALALTPDRNQPRSAPETMRPILLPSPPAALHTDHGQQL